MTGIVYPIESRKITGAIFEVHKRLGIGLLEKVYQEALEKEMAFQSIPYEREKRFDIFYREEKLDSFYIADFVCYDKIVVEVKAVSEITDVHRIQVGNYLGITGYKLGILANFNERFMKPQRIINNNAKTCW